MRPLSLEDLLMSQSERDLVVESLPEGGLLVMEPEAGRSHTLNAAASVVWQAWSGGERDVAALAARIAAATELPADEGIAHTALARLKDAGLVREEIPQPSLESVSRRRLLKVAAGLALALPLVETIVTPSPAAAQSSPTLPPAPAPAPPPAPPTANARVRRPVD
jgi:hypothetical protein